MARIIFIMKMYAYYIEGVIVESQGSVQHDISIARVDPEVDWSLVIPYNSVAQLVEWALKYRSKSQVL